jgi:hypothetical protein
MIKLGYAMLGSTLHSTSIEIMAYLAKTKADPHF